MLPTGLGFWETRCHVCIKTQLPWLITLFQKVIISSCQVAMIVCFKFYSKLLWFFSDFLKWNAENAENFPHQLLPFKRLGWKWVKFWTLSSPCHGIRGSAIAIKVSRQALMCFPAPSQPLQLPTGSNSSIWILFQWCAFRFYLFFIFQLASIQFLALPPLCDSVYIALHKPAVHLAKKTEKKTEENKTN